MINAPIYSSVLQNEPEFAPIVKQFIQRLPAVIANLNEAQRQQNWDRLWSSAHDLKGTAGNLGFPQIMRVVARIEANANLKVTANTADLIAELAQLSDRIALAD